MFERLGDSALIDQRHAETSMAASVVRLNPDQHQKLPLSLRGSSLTPVQIAQCRHRG